MFSSLLPFYQCYIYTFIICVLPLKKEMEFPNHRKHVQLYILYVLDWRRKDKKKINGSKHSLESCLS